MTSGKWLTIKLDDEVNMGHLENVRRLLQQGADVNGRNAMGDTPLIAAARTEQADMVRLLLEFGADRAATCFIWGKTASQRAHELGHEAVIAAFAEWDAEMPRNEFRG